MDARKPEVWSMMVSGTLEKVIEYFFDSEEKVRMIEVLISSNLPDFPVDMMENVDSFLNAIESSYQEDTANYRLLCDEFIGNLKIPDFIKPDEIYNIFAYMLKYDGILSVARLEIR
jgi:hypothetical protein